MFGLFRRHRHGSCGHHSCKVECSYKDTPCELLSEGATDSEVCITCNDDHKTVERGLYRGVRVRIIRNETNEPNIIVAVGDARYVLDRRIARRIRVRESV
jgi:Fe2+ transport system protein FeoA